MRKYILLFGIILCIGILFCGCGSADSNKGKLELTSEMERNVEHFLNNKQDAYNFQYDAGLRVKEKGLDILIYDAEVTSYKKLDDYNYKAWIIYKAKDAYGERFEMKSTAKVFYVAEKRAPNGYRIAWDISAIDSEIRELKGKK